MLLSLEHERNIVKSLGIEIDDLNSAINRHSEEKDLLSRDLGETKLSLRSLQNTHDQKLAQLDDTEEQLKRITESHELEMMQLSTKINKLTGKIESLTEEKKDIEKRLNDQLIALIDERNRLEGLMVCRYCFHS